MAQTATPGYTLTYNGPDDDFYKQRAQRVRDLTGSGISSLSSRRR